VKTEKGLNLSLFITPQFFSYAVFNADFSTVTEIGSKVISAADFPGKNSAQILEFLIADYRLSSIKFKNVHVSILNSYFSLLPEAFAIKDAAKEIIEFSSGLSEIKNTTSVVFKEVSFTYTFEAEIQSLLERTFRQAVFHHAGSISIALLFANHSLKNSDIFLNFHPGSFELAAKQNGKFCYYNVFSFETNEDILYYLLFMMEQYEFDPLLTRLTLAGQLEVDSELVKSVKKYIRHVSMAVSDKSFSNSFAGLRLPEHFYFSILNQHLCES
jgi:hypothetical protein